MEGYLILLVPLLIASFILPSQTMNSFKWKVEGCYDRVSIGKTVDSKIVRQTVMVKDVSDCQKECTNAQFDCVLLSFEISTTTNGSCLLSDENKGRSVDNFLIANPDADVYMKRRECRTVSNDLFPPPVTGLHRPTYYPSVPGSPFYEQDIGKSCYTGDHCWGRYYLH